jgi:hypothetical protein
MPRGFLDFDRGDGGGNPFLGGGPPRPVSGSPALPTPPIVGAPLTGTPAQNTPVLTGNGLFPLASQYSKLFSPFASLLKRNPFFSLMRTTPPAAPVLAPPHTPQRPGQPGIGFGRSAGYFGGGYGRDWSNDLGMMRI